MKLKEIPVSIYTSIILSSLSVKSIVSKTKDEIPVIVSLTSIPERLQTLHLTIRSILNQDARPKKIILWLHKSLKNEIPSKLRILECDLFQIMYSDLTSSHRKLIHSLKLFPEEIIITCDDDMMYRSNWLRLLYYEHQLHPNDIIGNQTRYIRYTKEGELQSYKNWVYDESIYFNRTAVIPIGAEGVLYPPKTLSDTTTNYELFLALAPKADDLWFKVMALLNGTNSILAKNKAETPIPIIGSQKYSLKKSNIGGDKNRTQWLALTQYFNIKPKTFL
ncbi:zinc-binding alcohol dehydrogenase [uncultured Maribacter sp.]|uniref:zinc-binding alcohol dehydrogenase n=1 Tax=uncultured Maribacter sp. TaxID=431308 RepID=UPI0030DDB3F5|tara:strand:- start:1751 stop:2581 length:831 start_codon:yes stop_codon:yes gene_type:complete